MKKLLIGFVVGWLAGWIALPIIVELDGYGLVAMIFGVCC